jgi:RNA polymerase sigma-70 factor (ECF subfamily)
MSADPSFDDLMARLYRGDEDAAALVFRRYGQRLVALASGQLGPRLRQKVDPEDILQSVLRSFFVRQAGGQYHPHSWDSLWSLLTVITLRKCGYQVRHFRAGCRDMRIEVTAAAAASGSATGWEGVARDPTPSEAARLTETVEELLRGLEGRDRQIIELSLQGYTPPEISAQVGRTERTIYRLQERVKKRLERLSAEVMP